MTEETVVENANATVTQVLEVPATLYFDNKTSTADAKLYKITVYDHKTGKKVGTGQVDLATFLGQPREASLVVTLDSKRLRVKPRVQMTVVLVKEVQGGGGVDSASEGSSVVSDSSYMSDPDLHVTPPPERRTVSPPAPSPAPPPVPSTLPKGRKGKNQQLQGPPRESASISTLHSLLEQLEAEKAAIDSQFLEVLGERDMLQGELDTLKQMPPSPNKRDSYVAKTSVIQKQLAQEIEELEKEVLSLRSRLNTSSQTPSTLRSGFLEKKSEHLKRFRVRYVVLTSVGLFSFHSQDTATDLDSASVRLLFGSAPIEVKTVPDTQGLQLAVVRGKNELVFRCESEASCREWIRAINEACGEVEVKGGGVRAVETMKASGNLPLSVSVEFVVRQGQEDAFRAEFLGPIRRLEQESFVRQLIVQERRSSIAE